MSFLFNQPRLRPRPLYYCPFTRIFQPKRNWIQNPIISTNRKKCRNLTFI